MSTIIERFQIKTVLEAPLFGFTGISGINSMHLAKLGCQVTLVDHDTERIAKIKEVWKEIDLPVRLQMVSEYTKLPFSDEEFDLSWNFAALWFVENLESFLQELSRVTSKIILIFVPNCLGIGYLSQKISGKKDLKKYLNESYIIPKNIKRVLDRLNWSLIETNFIDCPPWPDIGMHKEKFLKKVGLGYFINHKQPDKSKSPLTILNYYKGLQPGFQDEMLKYYWFEKYAPWIIKRFWAHHRYFLFMRNAYDH